MIVILTGATHTGKTRLAQLMLEKYRIPYVSEDHIKMGLIRSGYTDLTPADDDKMTAYLWPIIREMIKTAVENRQSLIVEGCYVPFDWKADFPAEYRENIRYICLGMTDAYIDANFGLIKACASCIEARLDDSYCTIENLKRENRYYREGCAAHQLEICLIDEDYETSIERIVSSLKEENRAEVLENGSKDR